MSSPLTPCLTIVNDKLVLCVSAWPVRPVSAMHQQGSPFPMSVQEEYDDPKKAISGLESLAKYYSKSTDKKVTKRQEKLQKRIENSPFVIRGKKQKEEEAEEEIFPE